MSDRFESLSRKLAAPVLRRRALRVMGATVAAAAGAAFVRPFGASGRAAGVVAGSCSGAGEQVCGPGCCPKGYACASSDASCGCCCRPGTTPCGTTCCRSGIACLNAARGICGCEAGTTPCGDVISGPTCCPAGTACAPGCPPPSGSTVKAFCGFSDVNLKEHIAPVRWD